MKRAVLYYSLEGNCKTIALRTAKLLGIPCFAIEAEQEIPKSGFQKYLQGGKQVLFKETPAIKPLSLELANYDDLILVCPVWAHKAASPINTLLLDPEIAEKITSVIALSMSGQAGGCFRQLKKKLVNLHHELSLVDEREAASRNNPAKLSNWLRTLKNS